jgi:hypothetical protein
MCAYRSSITVRVGGFKPGPHLSDSRDDTEAMPGTPKVPPPCEPAEVTHAIGPLLCTCAPGNDERSNAGKDLSARGHLIARSARRIAVCGIATPSGSASADLSTRCRAFIGSPIITLPLSG